MAAFAKIQYFHMLKQIFIDLQKFKYYSLMTRLAVKIKKSEILTANNDMRELRFWKLFT